MKKYHETEILNLYFAEKLTAHEIFKKFKARFKFHQICKLIAENEILITTEKFYIIPSKLNYI